LLGLLSRLVTKSDLLLVTGSWLLALIIVDEQVLVLCHPRGDDFILRVLSHGVGAALVSVRVVHLDCTNGSAPVSDQLAPGAERWVVVLLVVWRAVDERWRGWRQRVVPARGG
jgi:hypothetical protein